MGVGAGDTDATGEAAAGKKVKALVDLEALRIVATPSKPRLDSLNTGSLAV